VKRSRRRLAVLAVAAGLAMPIVTATTVVVPGIPWQGSARPVLSFQEAIDSTDSACNPSHTLQTGTMKESALVIYWLAQGFALNTPDFDGKFNTVPVPEQIVNAVTGWPPAVAWTSAVLRGLRPGPKFKADFQPLPPGFPGS